MLLEAINYYLENRDMNNVDSVMEVRKIVEEALSDQMRWGFLNSDLISSLYWKILALR